MHRDVKFDVEARDGLKRGVDKLANAVKVTLGPKGRIVVFKNPYTGVHATKDGVTVAEQMELEDNLERMGADMIMEAASNTGNKAGDGTTSSTVLAQKMVELGLKNVAAGANPIDLKRGMDVALNIIVNRVKDSSEDVMGSVDKIRNVATISANNDSQIGNLIAEAFEEVGTDGVITVEESTSTETYVETVKGLQFDRGFLSPYFMTDTDGKKTEYDNVKIIIVDDKINTQNELQPIIQYSQNNPVLLICNDITTEALTAIVMAKVRGNCNIVAIKSPFIGEKRKETLEDIAILTGAYIISEKKGYNTSSFQPKMAGGAEKCVINTSATIIVNGTGKDEDVVTHMSYLEVRVDNQPSGFEQQRAEERVQRLKGGVAVLYVGAASEVELKEKRDRIDDSLAATKAALEEGIVAGGGVALLRASDFDVEDISYNQDMKTGIQIIFDACKAPIKQISKNSGQPGDVIINNILASDDVNSGYDFKNDRYCDMIQDGIIDPTMVVRIGLENAVSVAGIIIMTDCALVNLGDEEQGMPQFMK
tara:strand:+ start:7843 stop:9450 length:1608 start_codon:yes stop_codon:yes gene_type:complete